MEKHLYSHTHPDVNLRQLRAGRELKPDAVAAIRPGVTSREELTQRFGAPDGEELTLTGHRLVYWLYVSGFALTGVTDAQALEVVLDDVGKVLASRVTRRQTGLD